MSHRLLCAACVIVASLAASPRSGSAQESPPASDLAPARPGLVVVPIPRLDSLEPAVAGQLREARLEFERVVAKPGAGRSDVATAYGSLGQAFHAYEFFEAAEGLYANALRLAPGEVKWLHLLAYLYQQIGRLEEAADRFLAALRAGPDDHAAAVRLGEVYLGLNRLRDAREQFESVQTRFPAAARSGLGEVALREGRFEEAIRHFRAVLERAPQATAVHYSLAMAYRGLGRLAEARSHLEQRGPGGITPVDPIVESLQTLVRGERLLVIQGSRAYEAGKFDDAARAFRQAIGVAPDSVSARVNLGLALSQLGDTAGALEQLRIAFEQAPGDTNASGPLIRTLLRLKREDEAIEILTRVTAVDPADEGMLVSLSILLAHRERYREAVALLEDGHRRFPDRTTTATTLARLLASSPDLSLRNGPRALELAMAVYATSPTPADGETIALALAELGRCDQALEWMQRAVAEAERTNDAAEAARLRVETRNYVSVSCRSPGK
jgi:tetratricopeptide (TPR) repeat protein